MDTCNGQTGSNTGAHLVEHLTIEIQGARVRNSIWSSLFLPSRYTHLTWHTCTCIISSDNHVNLLYFLVNLSDIYDNCQTLIHEKLSGVYENLGREITKYNLIVFHFLIQFTS